MTPPPLHLPSFLIVPFVDWYLRRLLRPNHFRFPPIRRRKLSLDPARRAAFEGLWRATLAQGGERIPLVEYDLPYPKIEFLHYLCDECGLVTHGSILTSLEVLEPVRLTKDISEFGNRQQIFASPDAAWAAWFAIVDKSRISQTSNGCIRVSTLRGWTKLYFFYLPRNVQAPEVQPFTTGMIHITRAEDFPSHRPLPGFGRLGIEIEEWGSEQPVVPLAKLPFGKADFPYLDRVEYLLG
jgi:hypothetical protein